MNGEEMTHLEAVGELENTVNELEGMKVPNVDLIEPLMQRGVKAYSVASSRINSVKNMLEDLKKQTN
ncbi:hypothetical protein [Vibrio owensii]|uniref:hypothetical protein n=1 Tax=Vibrio harveyi group TaxID=717610 RepID=UPI003CC54191